MAPLISFFLAAVSLQGVAGTTTTTGASGGGGDTSSLVTISGSMTIQGVDYSLLNANSAMKTTFMNTCATQIAATATGISASDVTVTLSAGSVAVDYTITVPSGVDASGVQSSVATAATSTLATQMATAISAISGINSFTDGSISVTGISTPTLTDPNSVESSGASHCVASMLGTVAFAGFAAARL